MAVQRWNRSAESTVAVSTIKVETRLFKNFVAATYRFSTNLHKISRTIFPKKYLPYLSRILLEAPLVLLEHLGTGYLQQFYVQFHISNTVLPIHDIVQTIKMASFFSLENFYCEAIRQESCKQRFGSKNAIGNIYYFLPKREDVASRSSDCLSDKRFVSSRKLLTWPIAVDHFSLNDVILFVILKIVLCP